MPLDLSENDNQIRRSAAKGILGDLDRDGVVDEWDVKILVWYLMGDLFWKSYYDFELVDIDGDDDVDWTDLALLGSYVFTKPAPSNLYGIGEAVDAEEYLLSASLMPDPTKVDFKADGRWHNFTVTTSWKTQSQPPKHVDYTGPVTVRVDDSSILKMWWWQSSYYTCGSSLRDTDTAYNGQKVHFLACKEGAVTITLEDPQGREVGRYEVEVEPLKAPVATVETGFNIELIFARNTYTQAQKDLFRQAAEKWESVITRGYPRLQLLPHRSLQYPVVELVGKIPPPYGRHPRDRRPRLRCRFLG